MGEPEEAEHLGQAHNGKVDAALLAAREGHRAGQAPVQLHLQALADLPLLHGLLAEVPQRAPLVYLGRQQALQHASGGLSDRSQFLSARDAQRMTAV